MAIKTVEKKDIIRQNIPRVSDYFVDREFDSKVIIGFADKEPRYIVESKNNVVYKKQ